MLFFLTVIDHRVLSYVILPKVVEITQAAVVRERENYSRIQGAIFSIGDLVKYTITRDGSKVVKFPEKLLKILEQRSQDIAVGKDASCVKH
jgi:hypothetical protein